MYRDFGNGCSCKGNGLWDARMGKVGVHLGCLDM